MVVYTVSDGTNIFPLAELEINYTGTELDEAQFMIAGVYNLDTPITIYADATVQFIGIIKDIEEVEQGALYKYTAYETAVELKTMPYLNSTLDIFTKTATVANFVTDILTSAPASGWTLASGMVDTTSLTLNIYMVNRLQALNKVLRETRGYYVLFDSSAKTVKFLNGIGINTDRTGAGNITYVTKTVVSSSMLRGITQVTVIGKDSSIRANAGSSSSSRVYYQVDDITSNSEAQNIADSILADVGILYAKYKVTVDPSQIQYDVRDKIKVDGVDYWITDLVQGMDDIELTIDTGKLSVVESLGSRIHLIEGNFPAGSDASWSGGTSNVAANGTALTTFTFDIKDVALITNAKLDLTIGEFVKSADVDAITEYLSDISIAKASSDATDVSVFGSPLYLPYSTGISCGTFAHGFQFGMASFDLQILADSVDSAYVTFEYKRYGGSWISGTDIRIPVNTNWKHICLSFFVSGDATAESIGSTMCRLKISSSTSTNFKMTSSYVAFSRIPRHAHSVTTTYDRTTTGTPPTSLGVQVNSTTYTYSGTPITIPTSVLVTGKNTINIWTGTGANNQCSVNPTITYQTLGKS